MNAEQFLREMNDIDDDLLRQAERPGRKLSFPLRECYPWLSLAACFIMLLGSLVLYSHSFRGSGDTVMVAFEFRGTTYEVPGVEEYAEVGLLETLEAQSTRYLSPVGAENLGNFLGTIEVNLDGTPRRCRVYGFAGLPEDPGFCVVEFPNGEYRLYRARREEP